MDSDILDTQPSQIQTFKLMRSTKNFEEYEDVFINQSISAGLFSINQINKKNKKSPLKSCESEDEEIINVPHQSARAETQLEIQTSSPLSTFKRSFGQSLLINLQRIKAKNPNTSIEGKDDPTIRSRNIYQKLIQYFFVKTFIKKLSKKKKMNSQFSLYHFNVINDNGSVIDMKSLNEKNSSSKTEQSDDLLFKQIVIRPISRWMFHMQIKTNQIIERIPIFYPESMSKLIWDGFAQIARIYFIYIIPLDLSFHQQQFIFGLQYTTTIIMILVLLFDFLISLNTAHYEYGQIVIDRTQIVKHVIGKSGGLEIISVGLIVLIWAITVIQSDYKVDASTQLYQLSLMIFFIQYRNISKFVRQVEEALNLSKPTKAILELMKLIIGVMVVLHTFACLWYWAGYYSHLTYGKSWLNLRGLIDVSWQEDYLHSFYYSAVTMFTVGYGDITPQSDLEILISLFFMMITSIQLSYSVSTVGTIIDKITVYEEANLKKLQTINTFMKTKKIGYQLQYQIREYLNYFWQAQNEEDSTQEKAIISQLSENLRERLMLEANSQILNNCALFRDNFSAKFKIQLVKCIKQVFVQPENEIDFSTSFPENKKNQSYICFIEKGSIEIHLEKEKNQLNSLMNSELCTVSQMNEGQSLGVVSFLTGERSPEKFRSIGFTKLLLLSREDFLRIIIEFPKDQELYQCFRDQLKLYQNFKFLKMTCFSCKSADHSPLECPLLHFVPDREFLIKQEQFSRDQDRNESTEIYKVFKRKEKKVSVNSRIDQVFISEQAIGFQNENWQETIFFDFDYDQSNLSEKQSPDQLSIQNRFSVQNRMSIQKNISSRLFNNTEDQKIELINKTDRRETSYFIQKKTNYIDYARFNTIEFEKEQLRSLSSREKFLIHDTNLLNASAKFQRDNILAEFTILKMQMSIESNAPLNNFEQMKTFKSYFPLNNFDQVMIKNELYYQPNQQNTRQLPQIYSQLVKYLIYPYDYIDKFIFSSTIQKQTLSTRKKYIYPNKSINPSRKQLKKKSVQSVKSNQIRPTNEDLMFTSQSGNLQE